MVTRDLQSNVSDVASLSPAALTNGTVNGTGVDLQEYDSAMVVFFSGAVTDGSHALSIEESDTLGSGYTTVAAADLIGTLTTPLTGTEDDVVTSIGYKGSKRYIRPTVVTTGATTGGIIGAVVLRGHAHQRAVA